MGKPTEETELLIGSYTRFVAIFTWPPKDDAVARKQFGKWVGPGHDFKRLLDETGIIASHMRAYSLIGARTAIVIGLSKSMEGLHRYCSEIIVGTGIEAKFYYAVDFDEVEDLLK